MAKSGTNRAKPLDTELTRFLVMLSFDEEMRQSYKEDPAAVVASWPFKLEPMAKRALEKPDTQQIAVALISQFGFLPRRRKPAPKRKPAGRKTR